jgi:hypothetical protein
VSLRETKLTPKWLDSSQEFFQLVIMDQFYVYGGYCIALALVFWILCHENYLKTGTVEIVPASEESATLI